MNWLITACATVLLGPTEDPARVTHAYDIRFLTEEVPNLAPSTWPSAGRLLLPGRDDDTVSPITFTEKLDGFALRRDDSTSTMLAEGISVDPDDLVELIRSNLAEDSWSNTRNSISASAGSLIVTQTPDVQRDIGTLLETLGARRAHMATVEVLLLPSEAVGKEKPLISDDELEMLVRRAGAMAQRISVTAYNEQAAGFFRGGRRSVLLGAKIDQTGVVPVLNPVVVTLPLGLTLEVVPLAIAGTDWTRVAIRVARLRETGKLAPDVTPIGEFQNVRATDVAVSTTLLVKPGLAACAGVFADLDEDASERRFAVFTRVRPLRLRQDREAAKPADDAYTLRLYDIGFVTGVVLGDEGGLQADHLAEMLPHVVDPDAWEDERASVSAPLDEGRYLKVVAKSRTHTAVRAWIGEQIARRGRLGSVVVEELRGPLTSLLALRAQAESGMYLADGW
jgi:hypothetical protein